MEFVRVGALGEIPEGEMRAYDTPSGRTRRMRWLPVSAM